MFEESHSKPLDLSRDLELAAHSAEDARHTRSIDGAQSGTNPHGAHDDKNVRPLRLRCWLFGRLGHASKPAGIDGEVRLVRRCECRAVRVNSVTGIADCERMRKVTVSGVWSRTKATVVVEALSPPLTGREGRLLREDLVVGQLGWRSGSRKAGWTALEQRSPLVGRRHGFQYWARRQVSSQVRKEEVSGRKQADKESYCSEKILKSSNLV